MRKGNTYYAEPNVGCLLEKAHQLLTADLAAALADAGIDITVPEYLIIRTLYTTDGLQQCEIADILSKDRASVCRSIKALERKGLVTTQAVSYKCQRVFLTDTTRRLKPDVIAAADRCHGHLEEMITPGGMSQLTDILHTIIERFD